MSIKANYNFKGIKVKDAIIKVERIFGSSKEGWDSLVGVYIQTKEIIPATPELDGVEAKEEYEVIRANLIEEFNFPVPFQKDERGYENIYKALMDKYGGIKV